MAIVNPIIAKEHRHLNLAVRPFLPSIKHTASAVWPANRSEDRLVLAFVHILKDVVTEELEALRTGAAPDRARRTRGS